MPPSNNTTLNRAIQDFREGNLEEAKRKLTRVLNAEPRNITALEILGATFFRQGDLQGAVEPFEKITKLKPDQPEAWHNLGIALLNLRRYERALKVYDRVTSIKADDAEAWSNHGNALAGLGQYEKALSSYDQAIRLRPDHADAWSNRGNVLKELQRCEKALECYDKAIDLKPDHADAWSNRAITLVVLKRHNEALTSFDKAISIRPNFAETWSNRGVALKELKQYDQALASLDKAISLKPDYADAWSNRGIVLKEIKHYEHAIASFDKAVELKPDFASAWFSRGNTLTETKRQEDALASYDKVISINPEYEFCLGQKLYTQLHMCNWESLQAQRTRLAERVSEGIPVSLPFPLLALFDDPQILKRAADIFVKAKFPLRATPFAFPENNDVDKIRIGYYSADFHNHATAYLMAELFEVHNRDHFEIFAFSFGPNKQDDMRKRISAGVDHFHDVSDKSDREIAELSRTLGIHIAVDLKGFTKDSRTGIFAEICAPMQINYLGYPGTMAAPYIDYIVADAVLIPTEMQNYYTEKIVYLPDCYQINDSKRAISKAEFAREDFGLPDDQFVFCCFNNNYKILPETFDSWMRILQSVEGSVLWLIESNAFSAVNLRREATARGIDERRLVFAKSMELDKHLARQRLADLFLDSLPCNAHTTTSDALWAGLPVLTQVGQSFAARVSASLLKAIGLTELITYDAKQFESLAIELASDPSKLATIREKLKTNKTNSSLFNARTFAKHIESAYSQMVAQFKSGKKPDHIYVTKSD